MKSISASEVEQLFFGVQTRLSRSMILSAYLTVTLSLERDSTNAELESCIQLQETSRFHSESPSARSDASLSGRRSFQQDSQPLNCNVKLHVMLSSQSPHYIDWPSNIISCSSFYYER